MYGCSFDFFSKNEDFLGMNPALAGVPGAQLPLGSIEDLQYFLPFLPIL